MHIYITLFKQKTRRDSSGTTHSEIGRLSKHRERILLCQHSALSQISMAFRRFDSRSASIDGMQDSYNFTFIFFFAIVD